MKLSERMKHWPALTVHRVAEIEAALVSMEERLIALEPKKFEVKEVKPAPFLPISSQGPIPAQPVPIIEPSILPAPKPPGFNKPEVTPAPMPTPAPFVPAPYVPPSKPVDEPKTNIFGQPEPETVKTTFNPEPVRLGPTPAFHDNPLDGTNLKS